MKPRTPSDEDSLFADLAAAHVEVRYRHPPPEAQRARYRDRLALYLGGTGRRQAAAVLSETYESAVFALDYEPRVIKILADRHTYRNEHMACVTLRGRGTASLLDCSAPLNVLEFARVDWQPPPKGPASVYEVAVLIGALHGRASAALAAALGPEIPRDAPTWTRFPSLTARGRLLDVARLVPFALNDHKRANYHWSGGAPVRLDLGAFRLGVPRWLDLFGLVDFIAGMPSPQVETDLLVEGYVAGLGSGNETSLVGTIRNLLDALANDLGYYSFAAFWKAAVNRAALRPSTLDTTE